MHSLCFLVKHTPNLFLFFPFVPWTNPGCVCQEHTPPQRTGATCTWQSQKGCLPVLPSTQRGARSTQRPRRPLIPMSYPHNGGMRHTAPRGAPRKPTPFSPPAPCQPAPPCSQSYGLLCASPLSLTPKKCSSPALLCDAMVCVCVCLVTAGGYPQRTSSAPPAEDKRTASAGFQPDKSLVRTMVRRVTATIRQSQTVPHAK